jgi:hypothetical protein
MIYEFRQVVAQYTHVEAGDVEEAWILFTSGDIDPSITDYFGEPSIQEITK